MQQNVDCVNDMIEHIYLNSSMVDVLIRICCIKDISPAHMESLHQIRVDIMSSLINKLEHH